MYQLYFNGLPIYDPRGQELGLLIREPSCRLAVGEAGELSFLIDDDHPNAGELTKLTGVLELKAEGASIYKGRLTKDFRVFDLTREVASEGLLACLNDSVIPPFDFPADFENDAAYQAAAQSGNVVQFFLEWILAEHNSQVSQSQQIKLGDVTVADPNNYISRASSEYLTSMEVVRKKLEELLGGYLVADYSGDTTVLHYYADLPLTNMQKVVYGDNLLDLVTETDATKVYTAILPVGKDGLTIESLPDGEVAPRFIKRGRIIYSQETESQYNGLRIIRVVKWDDVTLPENLQTKALAQLSTDGVMLARTITAKAADLGGTDDIQRFRVGRYVELQSSPHGFSAAYPLMELEPDLLDPGNTTITMGATIKAASDLANGNNSASQERDDQQQIEMGKQEQEIKDLAETTKTQITQAIQTAESIVFSALESYVKTADYDEYRKTVSSEMAILADRITMSFNQTIEQITDVNGDLQKTVEKLEKHFDFGIDGLGIRASATAMTLTLDNDLIIFKKNGQPFGWWDGVDFHTGNIVIDVTERAQFGSFALVPRSNGSLDFLKVSGVNTAKNLISISATYSGGMVLEGTPVSSLTGIVVTAIYSDSSTEVVTGYTLSGVIQAGENLIAVTYGDKTTSIRVIGEAIEVELTGISASYTGGVVPAGTSLNALTSITVTARYSDGSSGAVTGYTLSGSIGVGNNTITVSYGDKTTTFTVIGEAVAAELVSISATYSGGSVPAGTDVSSLTGITVTARYSDGTTAAVSGYTLSGSIAEGNNTITVIYQGRTTTITIVGEVLNTDIVLGSATTVTVRSWFSGNNAAASTQYSDRVKVVDGAITLIDPQTVTFNRLSSGVPNNYDALLGKYVSSMWGGFYYIDPNATPTQENTGGTGFNESIKYSPAYPVSVAT